MVSSKFAIGLIVGITLIEVPYWWDRKSSSLEATIYVQRPELFTEKPTEKPISPIPPSTNPIAKTECM